MEKKDGRRKYSLDLSSFFEDSSNKYYWLGFLATDGNVCKVEPRIKLELSTVDKDAVEKLANFCKTDAPLKYRKNNGGHECVALHINSSKLKKYLAEYNIIPNKTSSFTMPLDKIPKEYIWDFIRGMMDGDGCITRISNKKYHPYGISFISANYECVKQMKKIWGLPKKHAISNINGSYIVQKYGKESLDILNKIYKNSDINNRLNRKYDKYRSLIEEFIS